MIMIRIRVLPSLFLMFIFVPMMAQVNDTAFVARAAEATLLVYKDFIGVQSGLFNGSDYRKPPIFEDQHPYFGQYDWQWGDIVYNGEYYDNVPFLYDITTDNLITESYINGQEIRLVKPKISHFTISGRSFVQMNVRENPGIPLNGFYEVFYNGPSMVIGKHQKNEEQRIDQNRLIVVYTERERYYVRKDGSFLRISRKSDLLKVFRDRKSDLRAFIREQNLQISKHNPEAFATVAKYYDSLTAGK
jgi:hypothetical protein